MNSSSGNSADGSGPAYLDALTHTSVLNKVMDVVAGVWDLEQTEHRAPDNTSHYIYKVAGTESVQGDDDRVKVDPKDFGKGGKYRAIVKLFLHFAGQKEGAWAMGTGWLIAPGLLVTAGHCAYDWGHKLGPLTKVKAFMGYNGRGSVVDESVQFRYGKRVATPAEWLKGPTKQYDVSFIMLDESFDIVRCMDWAETPLSGDMDLGVVGYPGDIDKGEYMYRHFLKTKFDLRASARLLTYSIDTAGGNSGSPVIRQTDGKAIGVHAYGGDDNNQASVIGEHGNIFDHYIHAIYSPSLGKRTAKGIHFIRATGDKGHKFDDGTKSKGNADIPEPWLKLMPNAGNTSTARCPKCYAICRPQEAEESEELGEELGDETEASWRHNVRVGMKFGGRGLATGSPLITVAAGPLAGAVAAIGGAAMRYAGNKLKQRPGWEAGGLGEEAGFGNEQEAMCDSAAASAVFGEECLMALAKIDGQRLKELGIWDDMKKTAARITPAYMAVAPVVLPFVLPSALQAAIDIHAGKPDSHDPAAHGPGSRWQKAGTTHAHISAHHRSVVQHLDKIGRTMDETEASFLQTIGGYAINSAGDFATKASREGIQRLQQWGLRRIGATESSFSAGPMISSRPIQPQMHGLVERAILGHAAGEAVLRCQPHHLEPEFWGALAGAAVKYLPKVIKYGKPVIKTLYNTWQSSRREAYDGEAYDGEEYGTDEYGEQESGWLAANMSPGIIRPMRYPFDFRGNGGIHPRRPWEAYDNESAEESYIRDLLKKRSPGPFLRWRYPRTLMSAA